MLFALAAVVGHLILLYQPGSPDPSTWPPGADKLVHVALFGVPAWALLRVVRPWWLPVLALVVHVGVSEWVQGAYIPYRSADVWDAVADLVGILLGCLMWKLVAGSTKLAA